MILWISRTITKHWQRYRSSYMKVLLRKQTDSIEDLVESLRELMQDADDNKSRQAIQHAIQQLEG